MILNLNTGEQLVGEDYCEDTSVWFNAIQMENNRVNALMQSSMDNHDPYFMREN